MKRKILALFVWLSTAWIMGSIVYAEHSMKPVRSDLLIYYFIGALCLVVSIVWIKRIDDREWRKKIERIKDE